jgi:hypothetical protein
MTSLALDLAHWFDQRLTDTEVAPSSTTRLYGLELLDRQPVHARSVFILEARSIGSALTHPSLERGIEYDAVALVEFPWIAVGASPRPGEFAVRQRGRLVRVLTYEGDTASVCRLGVEPDQVDDHDDVDA